MKFRYQNRSTVSKLRYDLKKNSDLQIDLQFENGALISKSSIDFEVELIFQTKNLISKSSLVSK